MEHLGASELLLAVTRLTEQEATFGIVTILGEHALAGKLLVTEDEAKTPQAEGKNQEPEATVRESVAQAISAGKATVLTDLVIDGERCAVAIEIIRPKPSVIVFGAGHVGQAVALMASMV